MKKIKFACVTLLLTMITLLHPSLNKGEGIVPYLHYVVYGNSVEIEVDPSLDQSKVQLVWESNNKELICDKIPIFSDNELQYNVPFVKGSQIISVYYEGNLVFEVNQYKNSKNEAHKYNLKLQKSSDGDVDYILAIQGPSGLTKSGDISVGFDEPNSFLASF